MQIPSAIGNIHQNCSQYPKCIDSLLARGLTSHRVTAVRHDFVSCLNSFAPRERITPVNPMDLHMELEEHNKLQQKTWAAGDFPKLGAELSIVGETLCESVPIHAEDRVLDIGTASGNTALSAARRRAQVTGVDITPA